MVFDCNRLRITQEISESAPIVVIREVAVAHRIDIDTSRLSDPGYVRAVVRTIYSQPTLRLATPLGQNKQHLRRYLDTDIDEEEDLIQIYNHWEAVIGTNVVPTIGSIGRPTKLFPFAYNACLLYRICNNLHIRLPRDCTIETMAMIAIQSTASMGSTIDIINCVLRRGSLTTLLNLLATIPTEHISKSLLPTSSEANKVEITYDHLNQIRDISKRTANTDAKAVALAATYYGINLLHARHPLKEYQRISQLRNRNNYVPEDVLMKSVYNKNPDLVSLKVFDPRIPERFYPQPLLFAAVCNEGYSTPETDRAVLYEQLQLAYVSETFYHGWYPGIKNEETPFLFLEVQSVPVDELLLFGARSAELTAITLDEVIGLLKSNGSFQNSIPGYDGYFSPASMAKLCMICETIDSPKSLDLIREIRYVQSLQEAGNQAIFKLSEIYSGLDRDEKIKIALCIKKLLDLSMYTRGWDGNSELPLSIAPVDNQNDVDIKVTGAIADLEEALFTLDSGVRDVFLNLPLIKYDKGVYTVSNDTQNGKTLGARIQLLKQGDDTDNIQSCMRLSSNWFAASAWRYCTALGLPEPFDIQSLRYIL